MDIKTLESFKLADAVTFHNTLNPKLWRGQNLRPEVEQQLKLIAEDFIDELGIKGIDVRDITVSGSNAAYSYTPHSDLDLHILVDLSSMPDNEVYREFFDAKKTIYNDSHTITVHGIPVELYVQDASQPVVSLGEYSILNNKWIRLPTKRRANFDQTATKSKYQKLLSLIELGLKSKSLDTITNVLKTIKRYRQAGLTNGGEFGPENLAYKALRKQDYITRLYQLRDKLHSADLTIENMYAVRKPVKDKFADRLAKEFKQYRATDEDYDPNGPPPGPEFKPTMPAGTVRVDVSDVYDWYKLGQNISDLSRVDPSIFGKGPPSTIISFGSEDAEHNYINALKNMGLDTTDIDPVDPKQPKNMQRQKTDPTFNVNEEDELTEGVNDPSLFKVVFIVGGPGSGKSYVSDRLGLRALGFVPINSDIAFEYLMQKKGLDFAMPPEEQDERNIARARAKELTKKKEELAIDGRLGLIIDGTGDSWEKFVSIRNRLETLLGYESFLVFVDTSLDLALYRNQMRERKVPNKIVVKKWEQAQSNLTMYKLQFDKWAVIKNDNHSSDKIEKVHKQIASWARKMPTNKQAQQWIKQQKQPAVTTEASGYIPSNKEKNDPRFKTALTVDVNPYSIQKNAKAFGFKVSRAGIPPLLHP
jgi:predicted kinase